MAVTLTTEPPHAPKWNQRTWVPHVTTSSATTLPNFLSKYSHPKILYIYIYIYSFFSSYEHEVKTPFVFEIGIFRPLVDFIMELIN